jgi:uncharacterized protein YcbK (DUF882 family)
MVRGGSARRLAAVSTLARGTLARGGLRLGLAGLILLGAVGELQNAVAEGDTRTLSFHHVHTGENITVTFRRDGRYVDSGLRKLDWFMRDWRKERETHMDPRLFDILWQVYREIGATKPIDVICGYRSPATNAMLHKRSRGVARFSQHMLGKAMDFYIPGVSLEKVREIGLQLQRGGVGFYPSSGSPFVHLDVGTVRHWPGVSRAVLVKLFPNGQTVHIPADGHPLPGYAQALATIERRGNVPNARSLEAARTAGLITAHEERVAVLVGQGRSESLLAMVETGKGHDYSKPGEAPIPEVKPTQLASLSPAKPAVAQVPLPTARPKALAVADAASPKATAPTMTVAANDIFSERGAWGAVQGAKPLADASPFDVIAAAEPVATGSTGGEALSYASEAVATATSAVRARPMGRRLSRLIGTADAHPAPVNHALLAKSSLASSPMAIGGQQLGSPWLRAAMLTPSVSNFMTTSRMGDTHMRWLRMLMDKPARSVLMTFGPDPQYGMLTDRFTGSAVVFLATATFSTPQTASLQ